MSDEKSFSVCQEMFPLFRAVINVSMDNCALPEKLKEAEVRAMYKKGSNNDL